MGRAALATLLALVALSAAVPALGARGSDPFARYLASADVCPGANDAAAEGVAGTRTMSCLLNFARRRNGLAPLRLDGRLNRAAELKVAENVRCGEFSHTACGAPFTDVFRRSGYLSGAKRYQIGENLAWGSFELGTPRSIVEAWLNSPGHRENLFRPIWREMGLAVVRPETFLGNEQVSLWANEFGARS
jgi:uncharacterized protein YkwD